MDSGTTAAPDIPERWISWYQWKAEALNRLFREQGRTGEPGNITAATVRHGEKAKARAGRSDPLANAMRPENSEKTAETAEKQRN